MRRVWFLAAIVTSALAGCAHRPPAPGLLSAPAEAHARGVAFLIANQDDDGGWGSFESARPYEIYLGTVASHRAFRQATSALCVLALQEPSRDDPAVARALERGLAHLLAAEPVARATGSTFYDTWAHTYLLQAMASLHRDDRFADLWPALAGVIEREIALLSRRQAADGGWGYYDFGYSRPTPAGMESTSFNTAAVLLALHEAQLAGFGVSPDVIADGIACLERLRLPSGAYIYGTYAQMRPGVLYNRVKGSLGRSQPCNLALWTFGRDVTPQELRRGLENLREHHHFIDIGKGRPYPHEAWYYTAGYYFLFGHYYAGRVIAEIDPASQEEFSRWLARAIALRQDPDGSWFDFPLYGYHKFYGTAFALLTLQMVSGTVFQSGETSGEGGDA